MKAGEPKLDRSRERDTIEGGESQIAGKALCVGRTFSPNPTANLVSTERNLHEVSSA
jgi:hypothetical protein